MLDGATRKLIGDSLDAEVYDSYGLHEVRGVAWECPTHSGYHVNSDSIVLELLRDGEPVGPGELGELHVTNLFMTATPMIRYRTGDMATYLDDDCPCGRTLPLIKEIHGRVVDFIHTKDDSQISPQRIMYEFSQIPGISRYKVTQKLDYSIEVLIQIFKETNPDSAKLVIANVCRNLFGNMSVHVNTVAKFEESPGRKFRVVESFVSA